MRSYAIVCASALATYVLFVRSCVAVSRRVHPCLAPKCRVPSATLTHSSRRSILELCVSVNQSCAHDAKGQLFVPAS